jgi:hypothetical protein
MLKHSIKRDEGVEIWMNHTAAAAAAAAAAVAHNVGLTRSSRRTKWQMITANRDAGAVHS